MDNYPLNYALNLLKIRDRTIGELRDKMTRKGIEPAEIEKTIQFLIDKDFLNDERFVSNFIRNKQEFGTSGKYKIKYKLIQLKVDPQLIADKLAELNPEEEKARALVLAQNWLQKKQSVEPEKRYEKLGRFLISRGFEIDVVREILTQVLK